jgi:3,4-dihydroxy 2-butanone 4-phosphate synthase/GTP cyclohydrolase II
VASSVLPTQDGVFELHAYVDDTGQEHAALVMRRSPDGAAEPPPLVRVHSECLTGDVLGSHRCDCGDQLAAARRAIAREGHGVLVYLRGHEGRGIGLTGKVRAYGLQDRGADTVDANLALGFDVDARSYDIAARILLDLGARRIRLLSANPDKERQLTAAGVEVTQRTAPAVAPRPENLRYLQTKRSRMGHDGASELNGIAVDVWAELLAGRQPLHLVGSDDELVDRYGPLATRPSFVVAQLGQSLDGFIACRSGDAVFVTGEQDRIHLHRQRALADAVVVGVTTVAVDDCRLTVRAVPGRSPVRVILDPTGRAPRDAAVFHDDGPPTLWCIAADLDDGGDPVPADRPAPSPQVTTVRLPVTRGRFDPRDVLAMLAGRGLTRVLVEGGGRTVSAFLEAGVLDRLSLTTAPVLIGDGVPGLRFTGTDRMAQALRAPSRRYLLGDDVCVELDLAAAQLSPPQLSPPLLSPPLLSPPRG